jgi:hypothetical protein
MQHAWGTAVETVGTFVRQALKSSLGEEKWLRFFALMGTAIANIEGTTRVPETPGDPIELRDSIRTIATELDVVTRLQTYGNILKIVDTDEAFQGAGYYLLELNPAEMKVTINPYRSGELSTAAQAYIEVEKRITNSRSDAVLVSVDSMAALRAAYPNYFLDTERFLTVLHEVIA